MKELLGAAEELIRSISKQPMMAFVIMVFIVMTYVQVEKLDKINETLSLIHNDNTKIHEYIITESEGTKVYVSTVEEIKEELAVIMNYIQSRK